MIIVVQAVTFRFVCNDAFFEQPVIQQGASFECELNVLLCSLVRYNLYLYVSLNLYFTSMIYYITDRERVFAKFEEGGLYPTTEESGFYASINDNEPLGYYSLQGVISYSLRKDDVHLYEYHIGNTYSILNRLDVMN
ncbi:hypothetical protein FPZ49_30160 [Paenibacillus cremeus]|uniref:Uncharacterized protein n=1 Tax=Paenibacillus cremeus TaxID=2163881 RepID=A0A559K000_9BACL|nr:hypothetical protein FPZ49_30160 [Paenibacillus cremeus]